MYNILFGGAAGDGIETMAMLFEKILKKSGFYVFTSRDFMSRVRGGHNFVQIRFGAEPVPGHCDKLDGIFAVDEATYTLHSSELKKDGFVLTDAVQKFGAQEVIRLPLQESAESAGNKKTVTSVAIGALLSLFGIDPAGVAAVLEQSLKPELAAVNLTAVQKGHALTKVRFPCRTADVSKHILISGNNAAALGAAAAGVRFYSAYPMSPSTTILEYFSEHGEEIGMVVEQAEDEIAAVNMAIGASYAGAPAMVGTSGGGFSLMVEALGFAGIAEIPLVIVDVQRPGPATGLPTRTEQSDLKFVISASQGEFPRMVIALKNQTDAFYQTARAVALAEKYRMPVLVLSDQYLADSTAVIPALDACNIYTDKTENPKAKLPYKTYELTGSGISARFIPGKSAHLVHADSDEHDEYGFITESAAVRKQMVDKRMAKLDLLAKELIEPEFTGDEQCKSLLVAFGSTCGAITEAVAALNKQGGAYGALVFGDIYPLPVTALKRYASKAVTVINVEQNATGQLAALIRETASINCSHSILKYDGRQMSAEYIIQAVTSLQGRKNYEQ